MHNITTPLNRKFFMVWGTVGLCTVKVTTQRLHEFILVNLVGFLWGAGEAPCVSYYLGNVGNLFHANMGNLFHANVGNLFENGAKITSWSKTLALDWQPTVTHSMLF